MVFFHVLTATRTRVIEELKEYFSRHPTYQKIEIQEKYAFDERVQFGMVVQNSTVSRQQLAADNFLGTLFSQVHLARVGCFDGRFIEWVREDSTLIPKLCNIFPTPPGLYFISILSDTDFIIDPLFPVIDESIVTSSSGGEMGPFVLLHSPVLPGTLELRKSSFFRKLCEGKDYIFNPMLGQIVLMTPLKKGESLKASYKYPGTSIGPLKFTPNQANTTALPGVIIAFGKQIQVGDQMAIVVSPTREQAARVFGGRWEINFNIDIVSRDPIQRDEIADNALIALWVDKKPIFESEGIIIGDIGLGGESEDLYDDVTEDYYYRTSLDFTLSTEWQLAVPYTDGVVKEIKMWTLPDLAPSGMAPSGVSTSGLTGCAHVDKDFCLLSDDELKRIVSSIQMLDINMGFPIPGAAQTNSIMQAKWFFTDKLGRRFPPEFLLKFDSRLVIEGRTRSFESIK